MLAFPGVELHEQGHGRGGGGVQSAFVLGLKTTVLEGFLALYAADAHNHPHGIVDDFLPFILAVRAVLPKGGDGGQHQSGVNISQLVIANAQLGKVAGPVGFNDYVHMLG